MPAAQSYELLPRSSSDDPDRDSYKEKPRPSRRPLLIARALARKALSSCRPTYILAVLAALLVWQLLFNNSYSPSARTDRQWERGIETGKDDRVFIAANIIDGDLVREAWGRSVLELVEMIGKDRVFVSVYGGPKVELEEFAAKLECEHEIVAEEEHPIALGTVPRTKLPSGEERIKRIAYLAEVRNKALEPLARLQHGKRKEKRKFDKVLFVNDVYFEPVGAMRLLWGTNVQETSGRAEYKAACGVDFVTSWKMYDTYATRDLEGYSIGVPIFPWFAHVGNDQQSRRDVLAGRAEVRVKSCWGGMVAFDARYFMAPEEEEKGWFGALGTRDGEGNDVVERRADSKQPALPLKFRSEPEPFWDASECCLIHADILALPPFPPHGVAADEVTPDKPLDWDTGVFMNPYVRVAYDASTFRWITFAKRFERLFSPLQRTLNYFAGMPRWNYRRIDIPGQTYKDKIWVSNHAKDKAEGVLDATSGGITKRKEEREEGVVEVGKVEKRATVQKGTMSKAQWAKEGHYEEMDRVGTRGGYCGVRQLLVLKKKGDESEGNWDNLMYMVPPLDV